MVALTGIERVNSQFSSVQFGLSQCKYVQFVRRDLPETCHRPLACQRGASAVTPKPAQNGAKTRPIAPVPITGGAVPVAEQRFSRIVAWARYQCLLSAGDSSLPRERAYTRYGTAMGSAGGGDGDHGCLHNPGTLFDPRNYSCRSATVGSTFVARRVGRLDAAAATAVKTAITVTSVTGSVAVIPNNKLDNA